MVEMVCLGMTAAVQSLQVVLLLGTGLSFQVRSMHAWHKAEGTILCQVCGGVYDCKLLQSQTVPAVQVPVVQILLGQFGLVSSQQFFAQWRYVIVGATAAAAVLTPSTDPFTQTLLALPLIGLYLGGAGAVKLLEGTKAKA